MVLDAFDSDLLSETEWTEVVGALVAPVGTDPRGNDRKLANQLKGELEDYDNSCSEDD